MKYFQSPMIQYCSCEYKHNDGLGVWECFQQTYHNKIKTSAFLLKYNTGQYSETIVKGWAAPHYILAFQNYWLMATLSPHSCRIKTMMISLQQPTTPTASIQNWLCTYLPQSNTDHHTNTTFFTQWKADQHTPVSHTTMLTSTTFLL